MKATKVKREPWETDPSLPLPPEVRSGLEEGREELRKRVAGAVAALTSHQWNLLLRVAKANEAHDEPPRIKGAMYVRDELSSGRRDRCVNCARPRFEHPHRDRAACRGFVALDGHVSATAGALIAATDCACHKDCGEDTHTGTWHQHEGEPCPVHPDAPVVG